MRKTTIDNLCDQYNKQRGLTYPSIGYVYFADVTGDGRPRRRRLWEITTPNGGVNRSILNGTTYRHTAMFLRREIEKWGGVSTC